MLSHIETPGRLAPPFSDPVAAFISATGSSPDKRALAYFGRTFTYAELMGMCTAAASAFDRAGLMTGDRMIIQLQNVPQFVVALLAAWSRGIVVVPVSPMYRAREVRKLSSDSGAKAIVMSPALWVSQGADVVENSLLGTVFLTAMEDFAAEVPPPFSAFRESVSSLPDEPSVGVVDLTAVLRLGASVSSEPLEVIGVVPDADATALLAYTSGTTGPPKGAMVSHRNLVESAWAFAAFNGVQGPREVLLCIAPLVHITGIGVNMLAWLLAGTTMVLGYRFHPGQALEEISRWQVTWTAGASTAFGALLSEAEKSALDTSSFRRAASGGAGVPAAMLERFERHFGFALLPGFGMTETTGSICSTPFDRGPRIDPATGVPSAGVVHPGAAVTILGPNDEVLERGERGEVCLRGPGVVSGYWHSDEAAASTFRNGWLHTGDVGFMDDEGWLYVVDRTKNMIVASGYKVWPREVEEVIGLFPNVLEVAVIGVPDDYRGETVKAYVSVKEGSRLSPDEIIAHCRKNLAAYKVPGSVELLEELPKNANGKILHRDLRGLAAKAKG